MVSIKSILAAGLLLAVGANQASGLDYVCVDFSEHQHWRMQDDDCPPEPFPEGSVEFGGIPFCIPEGGNNSWEAMWAAPVEGDMECGTKMIDVEVNVFAALEVHTIINTRCGIPGPESYASLEFFGSGGAYYRKDLVGDDDVRDWCATFCTNSINNDTTVNVFFTNLCRVCEMRLDKQVIALPPEFHTQWLETIRVTDTGGNNDECPGLPAGPQYQRLRLYGITVGAVPAIPTVSHWGLVGMTLVLLIAGTLIFARGRRQRA
jgi:hypothetical protein